VFVVAWNPARYLTYADLRLRPALDLVARIEHTGPRRVWDLGCGHGAPTRVLAERWPDAEVVGLDSSPEMLSRTEAHERIEWVEARIEDWSPKHPADIVFSNAALHWLDDHGALLPRLVSHILPGGVLAVQMPRNHTEPSHQRLYETARSDRWRERVGHLVRDLPVHEPRVYHEMLRPLVSSLDIWETVYHQELTGDQPVAEWARGSVMRPFLDVLGGESDAFFSDYARRLAADHVAGPDGITLFPFRRLFIVATI
jgi:trans-aconitate 2-methyltransferase